MSQLDDLDRVHCETRVAQWRAWLQRHHGGATGIWLVTWRKSSGRPVLAYDDMVEEALAFGWVDSKGGKTVPGPGSIEWIVTAKKPDTRANRVEETARLAARGERANQWPRTKR